MTFRGLRRHGMLPPWDVEECGSYERKSFVEHRPYRR
jgi:hypothetical protein